MKRLRIPKIRALDLRSLDVIVAEWNAAHPAGLHLRVWKPDVFRASVGEKFRRHYGLP